jgi:hypothetical protein
VQNFIAICVEMLKNDTSGQLTDSSSTSQATNNDMHIQLEMDMLKEILSAPSSNSKDALFIGTQLGGVWFGVLNFSPCHIGC